MNIRLACDADIPAMARIRAEEWETSEYWQQRIAGYMAGTLHPRDSLARRVAYVAVSESRGDDVAGFVAGHLTRRFGCDGELEWISVAAEYRTAGVGHQLMLELASWFEGQNALRICVDVDPENTVARNFYAGIGARMLEAHWMLWDDIRAVHAG